jgi:hypothetical protein
MPADNRAEGLAALFRRNLDRGNLVWQESKADGGAAVDPAAAAFRLAIRDDRLSG